MAESFNIWILVARHKTITIMLEDIRVKVMTRIEQMRSFANTWVTTISSMDLRALEANMEKSMECNIDFNGEFRKTVKTWHANDLQQLWRKNHNKRSCHRAADSHNATKNDGVGSSTAASRNTRPGARPRGRSRKETVASKAPPRPRGRPRKKTTAATTTPRPKEKKEEDNNYYCYSKTKGRPRKDTGVDSTSNASTRLKQRESNHVPTVVARRERDGLSTYPNKRAKTLGM